MNIDWTPMSLGLLPQDGELKQVSLRDENYYFHAILRYNVYDKHWEDKDSNKLASNLSVRAWADLLPIYTG